MTKTKKLYRFSVYLLLFAFLVSSFSFSSADTSKESSGSDSLAYAGEGGLNSIPFDQLGAEAQKKMDPDAFIIKKTSDGAYIRSQLQSLEASLSSSGVSISSTAKEKSGGALSISPESISKRSGSFTKVASSGKVSVGDGIAVLDRGGVKEEFTSSADGIRQDFVIAKSPSGSGNLVLGLDIQGGSVDTSSDGSGSIRISMTDTGRELVYSRLLVQDSEGKDLPANFIINSSNKIGIEVDDSSAQYPIRIDPTYTDENWVSMGAGVGVGGSVSAMVFDPVKSLLYVGGSFTSVGSGYTGYNRVAAWDGSGWVKLGNGVSGIVEALAVDSAGKLYVGGKFSMADDSVAVNQIAVWDPDGNGGLGTWGSVGYGVRGSTSTYDYVRAIAVDSSNNVYVGGSFTKVCGAISCNPFTSAGRIAKWHPGSQTWSYLEAGVSGSSTNTSVRTLSFDTLNNVLYVGGELDQAGSIIAGKVAKWTPSVDGLSGSWSPLGSGVNNSVQSSATDSAGRLYVGGSFNTAGGSTANNIARWDPSANGGVGAWSALGPGLPDSVYAIAISNDSATIYAGGPGDSGSNYIYKWDGSMWSTMGSVLRGPSSSAHVYSLLITPTGDLYFGGIPSKAGDLTIKYIAKWDNDSGDWGLLGSGLYPFGADPGAVRAFAFDRDNNILYAAGDFTIADGITVNRVAKWDSSGWVALGFGFNNPVYALALDPSGNLYAGGTFTRICGVSTCASYTTANRVAKWDGVSWEPLGFGFNNIVNSLALDPSGSLYAGGTFTLACGVSACNSGNITVNRVAKWGGVSWEPLSFGFNNTVNSLALDPSGNLYAGGTFTLACGVSACNSGNITVNRVAKWGGVSWEPLGFGFNNIINTLALDSSGNLYVSGDFTLACGVSACNSGNITATRIAKWNNTDGWSPLIGPSGNGLNNIAYSLAIDSSGNLYAGGAFTTAGGIPASRIAVWDVTQSQWKPIGSGTNNTVRALALGFEEE